MISFYGFYTTWTTLLGILSGVALGFILKGYNTTADDTCDVTQYSHSYNLYQLNLLLLITTLFTAILNFIGYSCTHKTESSSARKFIMFLMFLGFVIKCVGIIPMLIKFDKDHECFTFYENTDKKCMLITFISMSIAQAIEIIMVLLGLISMIFCSESVSFVNSKHNGYSSINDKYYN
jgi:cytochrome bd-type quinol oxidase subunit 2